jgi:hypothetical protein
MYEVLRETASGLEMPEGYCELIWQAEEFAIDLAHDGAEGGYTGRSVVRNGYDEAVITVKVRGPLTLIWGPERGADLPSALWEGKSFDYYMVRYSAFGSSARSELRMRFQK